MDQDSQCRISFTRRDALAVQARRRCRSRREVSPRQHEPNIVQVRFRVRAPGRAFRKGRQFVRDPRGEPAKLDPRQAHQFGYRQYAHGFLQPSGRANRGPPGGPSDGGRRAHLSPQRRGGARSACAHQAEEWRFMAEGRTRLVRTAVEEKRVGAVAGLINRAGGPGQLAAQRTK
jgi:hypothetical protein